MSVYCIRNMSTGNVKIGSSRDPIGRLNALSTGCDAELELIAEWEGGETEEKALHAEFHALRVRGEWFRVADGLEALLEVYVRELARPCAFCGLTALRGARLEARMTLSGSGFSYICRDGFECSKRVARVFDELRSVMAPT